MPTIVQHRAETGGADAAAAGTGRDDEPDAGHREERRRATSRTGDTPVFSTATSRSAASGGTRDARIAGNTVARSVTTMPTSERGDHRARLHRDRAGRDAESERVEQRRGGPTARPMPASRPRIDASNPIASDSSAIDASTWRRDAPIARSSADSRVRCAIRIENVL